MMDIKAIVKMKRGHFGHFLIDFENNLTGTFMSTSKLLKPEKLPDLTWPEMEWLYYPFTLTCFVWFDLYDPGNFKNHGLLV